MIFTRVHACMEFDVVEYVPNLFVMYAIFVTGHLQHGLLDWRKDRMVGKNERKNEHYCIYLEHVVMPLIVKFVGIRRLMDK